MAAGGKMRCSTAILFVLISVQVSCGQLTGQLQGTLGPGIFTVVGDIWVDDIFVGYDLTLLPATTFHFVGPYRFYISGQLLAEGTASDSIVFTTDTLVNPTRWGGLRFVGPGGGSRLAYCLVENGHSEGLEPYDCGGGVYCEAYDPVFEHCTVRNNWAEHYGGGVYCHLSAARFSHCAISGNLTPSGSGAGVCCSASSSTLSYCTISGNTAWSSGGGLLCTNSSDTLTNCTISGNHALDGGGVWCYNALSPTFRNCVIADNTAERYGGGACCKYSSSPTFTDCAVNGNTAISWYGGGVCCDWSWPVFTNCTINDNRAPDGGGVYCCNYASPAITHCTISRNRAGSVGGGVYCFDNSEPVIKGTIVAFSVREGIFFANSAGSQVEYCDFFGNSSGNITFWDSDPSHGPPGIGVLDTVNASGDSCDVYKNISVNPIFADTSANDFHLTDYSPCIGAADPVGAPNDDFEGDLRPNPPGTNPDIGMDEHWLSNPVGRLVITMVNGNAVLYWPSFASSYNIYGATTPYTAGTQLTGGVIGTTWTDINTSSRPSPYFYYVRGQ
jgi:parallel beta-helix repeat protein